MNHDVADESDSKCQPYQDRTAFRKKEDWMDGLATSFTRPWYENTENGDGRSILSIDAASAEVHSNRCSLSREKGPSVMSASGLSASGLSSSNIGEDIGSKYQYTSLHETSQSKSQSQSQPQSQSKLQAQAQAQLPFKPRESLLTRTISAVSNLFWEDEDNDLTLLQLKEIYASIYEDDLQVTHITPTFTIIRYPPVDYSHRVNRKDFSVLKLPILINAFHKWPASTTVRHIDFMGFFSMGPLTTTSLTIYRMLILDDSPQSIIELSCNSTPPCAGHNCNGYGTFMKSEFRMTKKGAL